jgi:hypothetical protein
MRFKYVVIPMRLRPLYVCPIFYKLIKNTRDCLLPLGESRTSKVGSEGVAECGLRGTLF